MAFELDVSKLSQAAAGKATPHDNCVVLDLGTGAFPRDIEVRLPDDDGARQNALWDGSLNLDINDEVLCFEYASLSAWRIMGMGGNDSGAGRVRVSEIWESDFGAVAMEADEDGNIGIPGASSATKLGVTGDILASESVNADNFAFIVENTSGATATANDVGYINSDGEYKTTTTANDEVAWCVVIIGGANNADIHVSRRGRATIAYTGGAPSVGDFLVTSTSAGDAQQQTTMRPEIFAIATAAGAGGTVEALLLTQRKIVRFTSSNNILQINGANDSDFQATIAAAGVVGDKVYHNAPSTGSVDAITPFGTADLTKIILHNTITGGNSEARIIATGTDGTGDFIQVNNSSDISGWVATEAVTTRSQTNLSSSGASRFFDLELTAEGISGVPTLTTSIDFIIRFRDSGGTGFAHITHPFESSSFTKRQVARNVVTADLSYFFSSIPSIDRRFTILWEASGAGTAFVVPRVIGRIEAAP